MLNFLSNWLDPRRRPQVEFKRAGRQRKALRFESLETRHMMSVDLASINNIQVPGSKSVLVPLTGLDSSAGAINYAATSDNPAVQVSLVSPTSKSLKLHVQASNGATFSGDLIFHLFEDLAPVTTARIEDLVNTGYYNGLDFFRIFDGFVAQGGRASNPTTQQIDDEFNSSLTFTSRGLLAMANAGDDTGTAEFFITAIDEAGSNTPISLGTMPQYLNFQHTIFGQLVSGFDLFEQIMTVPVQDQPLDATHTEHSDPIPQITITSAQIVTDTQDAVLRVVAPSGFTGDAHITVTAHGTGGATDQSTFTATGVNNTVVDPPFLDPVTDKTAAVGQTVDFTLTSQNPSGVTLGYATSEVTSHAILTVDQQTGHITLVPDNGFAGTITLIVGVRDASLGTDYDTQQISITWVAPTLAAVSNKTTAEGVSDTFSLSSTNPAGGAVTYSIVDPTTLAAPAHVMIGNIDPSTGQVTITPDPGFTGTINLLARVRAAASADQSLNYTTQAFTLTVVGLNEVSNKTTAMGVPVPSFTLTTTPTSNAVVFNVVDAGTLVAPTNVTVNVTSNGQVTLTPKPGVTGTIHLLARVRSADSADVAANYTTQSFDLVVSAPTLSPVADSTILKGQSTSRGLQATDPTGGGLLYDIVDASTLQPPANVTVVFGQTAGQVTLTPTAAGVYHLLARVRATGSVDDPDNYVTQAFTVTAIGLGPVTNKATVNGVAASFTLVKIPSDADLTLNIVDATTLQPPVGITVNIDQATGATSLTPTTGFSGAVNLLARARLSDSPDSPENYTTQAFTFSSASLAAVSDQATAAGTPVTFTLSSVPAGANVFFKIVDPETFGAPAHVTISINQNSGQVTLTPDAGFSGTIHLRAAMRGADSPDVQGNYTTDDFDLVVSAVTLSKVADQTVGKGVPASFTLSATTPGSGSIVYQIVDASTLAAPTNVAVTINQETGAVALKSTVPGTYHLQARVRNAGSADVAGNYTTDNFDFTVGSLTLDAVSDQTVVKGGASTFTLHGTSSAGGSLIYNIVDASTLTPPANVTINVNQETGQATLTPTAAGTFHLLARVRVSGSDDVAASYTTQAFTLTSVGLATISNQTTRKDTPVTLTMATVPSGANVVFSIVDPTTLQAPANVTVSINQTNGQATLTPASGFTGTIDLLARLRLSGSEDVPASYTTQTFSLTVTENPPDAPTGLALDSSSYTGPFDGNGYVSSDTVKLTVNAQTGTTVTFRLGGVTIATATETAAGSGVFTATLAPGKLAVGANAITAVATNNIGDSQPSTALSVTYAPSYTDGVYVVPGAAGSSQSLKIDWMVSNAGYKNEVGYFIADSSDGSIGEVSPGDAGYAQAALSSSTRQVIFSKGQNAGASDTVTLTGGQFVVFYIIQNNTTSNFLAKNPTNTLADNNQADTPMAFFSVAAANPDDTSHTQTIADPTTGRVQYNWEDLVSLGDSDFNDVVITIQLASQTAQQPAILHAPGSGESSVTLNGTLNGSKESSPNGDVGVFFVDDPDGTIDGVHPGDAGYLAKALATGNFKVLYAAGVSGASSITAPAGKYVAFYLITNGTTVNFLSTNPTNSTSGGPVALFSLDGANPDGVNHFRWYTPGTQATSPNLVQLHIMDTVAGHESDFDAYTINLGFAADANSD